MTGPDEQAVAHVARLTRSYLVLHGLRWLPTGLLIPILVLLFTSRGLTLAEFGVVGTIMATTTFVLEVPTGGLADTLGRRRVLLVSVGFLVVAKAGLVAIAAVSTRPAWWLVVVASVAMGVYRALESGPLDAWYVDRMQALDPDADIERGLGWAGMVTGFAIAAGSIAAGGLLAWQPVSQVEPMAVVLAVSLALVLVQGVAIAALMDDPRPTGDGAGMAASIGEVPGVISATLRLVRSNRLLSLLLVIEATWSVGMVAFENLLPVRLEFFAGSPEDAAALLGPVAAVAWTASGIGASLAPRLASRVGAWTAHAGLRLAQAALIAAMALAAGTTGLVAAFVATYLVHGGSGPVHLGLVHRQVTAGNRTTALSLNSMTAFASFSVAGIAIGALADASGVPLAMGVCAAVTALGAIAARLGRRIDTPALQNRG